MSFKSQVLIWFLVFSSIAMLTNLPINWYYFDKKEDITNSAQVIDSFYINLLKTLLIQSDFLKYETRNTEFFATNESNFLDSLRVNNALLHDQIISVKNSSDRNNYKITELLEEIQTSLRENNYIFEEMINSIYQRGFKDWGTEGSNEGKCSFAGNF